MLKNDSTPATASSETSTNKICTSTLKLVLAESQEKSLHVDPQMLNSTLPAPVWATQQSSRSDYGSNASEIKSGTALTRVYNIENAEVVNPNFLKKGKTDKSKELNKRQHYPSDKVPNREQLKKTLKTKEPFTTVNPQIKNQELTPHQEFGEKLKKRSTAEKAQFKLQTLPQRHPHPQPSPSERKKRLENRLTTKIWQILSRDMFLLDHEKFNNHVQATNSETKEYIINVIKKCNNKRIKRLNRPIVTQTSQENRYSDKKRAMKIAVRRRVWALAKAAIKRSKHWSQFLVENHIIVENIDIDNLDVSFIDFEALEIENKILKRIITWLFT